MCLELCWGQGYKDEKDIVSVLTKLLVSIHNNNTTRANVKWSMLGTVLSSGLIYIIPLVMP